MAITQSDRAKIIAFEWGGDTYLFEAGGFTYSPDEDMDSWQYGSGTNDFKFNWVHIHFSVLCGYLDQHINDGSSYTLPDGTQFAAAPEVGLVDVLNALNTSNVNGVYYYPLLVDAVDGVHKVKYRIIKEKANFDLMKAKKAGRFTPYVPVSFKTKSPLQEYPAWANR